jgi:LCP family protein required for cell wall assembly
MSRREMIELRQKKRRKRKKIIRWIIIGLLIIIVLVLSGTVGIIISNLNKVDKVEISETKEDLEISVEAEEQADKYDVTNFALFGIDTLETDGTKGRSDSIMIATLDKENNKIKLSSIMRDTYVDITGHGMDKITHAYAYGGPQLAVSTINKNFDLNITNFVTVDFLNMAKIIDALGGVEIEITAEELKYINFYIEEMAGAYDVKNVHVTSTGLQKLSGQQAVAYARIRYTSGGDSARTERQRTVLTALLNKLTTMDKSKFISTVPTLAQYVITNMDTKDMISIGVDALQTGISNIDQERFPLDGNSTDTTIDGVYYLATDLDKTAEQMHNFIYEDIKESE